jgi:hypothetical protein
MISRSPLRHRALAGTIALAALGVAACSDDKAADEAAPLTAPAVVTFRVAGEEEFKVELATDELVEHAKALLDGQSVSAIPIGTVVRGDPGVNADWSWHIDPATFSFADATIEVCDGLPSHVEDETVTSPDYCPWSAEVIDLEAL